MGAGSRSSAGGTDPVVIGVKVLMRREHRFETPPVAVRTGLPTPGENGFALRVEAPLAAAAPQEGDSGEGAHLRLVEAKSRSVLTKP